MENGILVSPLHTFIEYLLCTIWVLWSRMMQT